jgi:dTDP-4-amino-4,6-dideoxygalactose transaminase
MRRRYHHDDLGFNFRMTDVHAAIGLEQLKKLDDFNAARQSNAEFYSAHIIGVQTPKVSEGTEHVYHQYTIRVPNGKRDLMLEHLKENEIGCGVYYPVPVHQQNYYTEKLDYKQSLPESEKAAEEVLSLPVHPALSPSDLEQIVDAINSFDLGAN